MPDQVYSRFVQPETARLELSRGDWLVVRKELNAGQHRRMLARFMKPASFTTSTTGRDAALQVDQLEATRSTILAYLLDWSLVGPDGTPVVIRGKPVEDIGDALDALDIDSFTEIRVAIEAHAERVALDREVLKANPFGATVSNSTSESAA